MENEPCTLYDLEAQPEGSPRPVVPAASKAPSEPGTASTPPSAASREEAAKPSEPEADSEANPEAPQPEDPSLAEIKGMIAEMGAEKLLSIIRAERNAAIEQIKAELCDRSDIHMPSGTSVARPGHSIFDLASGAR